MKDNNLDPFLSRIELFKELNEEELSTLRGKLHEESVPMGGYLYKQNSPRQKFFMIQEGRIELLKHGPLGGERRLAYYQARDFLGEEAMLDGYPHATSARAAEDSRVLTITREDIADLMREHPSLAVKILSAADFLKMIKTI